MKILHIGLFARLMGGILQQILVNFWMQLVDKHHWSDKTEKQPANNFIKNPHFSLMDYVCL